MVKGIIYCASAPNNKKYLGRTIQSLSKRRYYHHYNARTGSNLYFHRAIKKYGEENIKWDILEEIEDIDKKTLIDKLNEREIYLIKNLDTLYPLGYNLSKGGGNYGNKRGHIQSKETREKRRKSMLGKNTGPKSEETKRKMSESKIGSVPWNKGVSWNEEAKEKMSRSHKGKKLSVETKKKMSQFQRGRAKSEAECKNIAESKKGNKNPMYGRSAWNKGLKLKNK